MRGEMTHTRDLVCCFGSNDYFSLIHGCWQWDEGANSQSSLLSDCTIFRSSTHSLSHGSSDSSSSQHCSRYSAQPSSIPSSTHPLVRPKLKPLNLTAVAHIHTHALGSQTCPTILTIPSASFHFFPQTNPVLLCLPQFLSIL